jgi:hypothetical protein
MLRVVYALSFLIRLADKPFMLNVIMLNVVILIVVAPIFILLLYLFAYFITQIYRAQ